MTTTVLNRVGIFELPRLGKIRLPLTPALLVRGEVSFDGEDLQSRLQRRKRGWIASVQIDCEG